MSSEKVDAEVGAAPAYVNTEDRKDDHLMEGGAILGDYAPVEEYGYVTRGLKSRHVQFIALGGTIGTGLFLGIGNALVHAGPLSLLLGYAFTGLALYAMMQSLGEMATWLPLPGAIPQFCSRYVDDALGFAVGWNNWYNSAITICAEISAASIVIGYWEGAQGINVAVWITILLIFIIFLNIFAVSIYGEAEFIFASIKLITIVGLLIMAFIVDVGGNPNGVRYGFAYWKSDYPGAMVEYSPATGDLGRFLGLFSTLINAAFSYGGVELVAVAAGECENPRKNIPKAVRRVFWRILFFYVLGTLAIGVLVASNDDHLLNAKGAGAARSPWVIGIQNAGITVLPSIINAVILTSATSSGNAFLYTGSRYLYALAQNRQAPKFFLYCSKRGVPYWAVAFTASIGLLTYMSASPDQGAAKAFSWFQNLCSIASLFTWCSICVAYIRFHAALKAQGIDRNTLVMKSPFQPYLAWIALVFFSLVILFNGFAVFMYGNWNVSDFIAAYVGIPIFFVCFFGWKLIKRTKWLRADEADLYTGKAEVDAEEAHWVEPVPRNWLERFWFWLA